MKVELTGLQHEPYVSLYLVPETQCERVLLSALWRHGRLKITNGVCDGSGQGFAVTQKPEAAGGVDE